MLLDPFEEQFDLPTATVELAYRLRRQIEVIGQEHQSPARLHISESNTSQWLWVIGLGALKIEHHSLIANQPAAAIDAVRIAALEAELGLGTDDEEAAGELKTMQ